MRYPEIFAAIEGVTSPEGPFPVLEKVIDGVPRKVFGGLPDSLRDYYTSSSRHGDKELLVDKNDLQKTFVLRRILNPMGTTDAIEFLIGKLKQTKSNEDFFDSMNT